MYISVTFCPATTHLRRQKMKALNLSQGVLRKRNFFMSFTNPHIIIVPDPEKW
jgi:hypothetical protein